MGQDDFTGLTESNASMTYQFARLMAQNESAGKALNDVRARMNLESSSFWMNTIGFNLYGDPSLGIDTHGSDTTTPQPPLVIQADQYSQQSGVQTEPCAEGGNNVGWIDTGDWMVYPIEIPAAGTYTLQYRVASPNNGGILSSDLNAGANQLGTINIPNTGGWQNWTTVSQTVHLPAGPQKFGIYAASGGWNLRWFRIEAQEPATFTAKLFKEPTPWYSEQGLETTTQEPITALSLSLKLAKTPGLSFNGSYASPGELIQRDHTETSTSLIYTFKLAPGAQLPTGTHRFAAQMGLQNTPHPLSGDRWSLTYTAGGQTYNQSGSF